jgi:hypothetical protein
MEAEVAAMAVHGARHRKVAARDAVGVAILPISKRF